MAISAQGLGYVFSAKDLASGPIKHLTANVKGLSTANDQAVESTKRAHQASVVSGRRMLVAGGLTLLAINSLTKSYGKFEHRLISAGAVMNATATEMEALEKAAIGAGIATQFSPEEAAQGLENLGAAGMDAATAIKTLNPVLDLAAASLGQLGVAESAANVVGVLNAFGDSADMATRRVDQLVTISQTSAFQARDFSVALSQASAQAVAADQSFESMAATLGMLRNANMDASSAATAYREAVRRVAGDTRAIKALRKLHINTLDEETGKIKDLGKIMTEVIPAMSKLNAQQRNLNLKVIFGVRGMKTYNGFLSSYRKNVKEGKVEVGDFAGAHRMLVEGMENAGGAAARTRDKLLASAEGRRILLKGSIETFKVVAGKALVPAIIPALKNLTGALNKLIWVFNLIPESARGFISNFAGAGATLLVFAGAVKMAVGVRGLMALDKGMDAASIATEKFTKRQALANTQLVRGMKFREQAAVASAKMGSSVAGALPFIGMGVAAMMGLSSMFDAQRAKERKRVQEVKNEQERVRNQMFLTQRRVEGIGKAAEKTAAKLIKLGRTQDLLQVQHVIRTNFAKAEAAEAEFQRNILKLDNESMTKKQRNATKVANEKLTLEIIAARKIVAVNEQAQLQIRANALKKKGGQRTEEENQIIVAASLQKIGRMKAAEARVSKDIAMAIERGGQKETVKRFKKNLKRMRKTRASETLKAGRRAGFKGKGLAAAEAAAGAFAAPVTEATAAASGPSAATGLSRFELQGVIEGRINEQEIASRRKMNPTQRAALRKFVKRAGPQFARKRALAPDVGVTVSGGQGEDENVGDFTRLTRAVGLGTPRAPSWWPDAKVTLSDAVAKAMSRVQVNLIVEGENVPTEKKNQNGRVASGKNANPAK